MASLCALESACSPGFFLFLFSRGPCSPFFLFSFCPLSDDAIMTEKAPSIEEREIQNRALNSLPLFFFFCPSHSSPYASFFFISFLFPPDTRSDFRGALVLISFFPLFFLSQIDALPLGFFFLVIAVEANFLGGAQCEDHHFTSFLFLVTRPSPFFLSPPVTASERCRQLFL